jgi:hypothetical protein
MVGRVPAGTLHFKGDYNHPAIDAGPLVLTRVVTWNLNSGGSTTEHLHLPGVDAHLTLKFQNSGPFDQTTVLTSNTSSASAGEKIG